MNNATKNIEDLRSKVINLALITFAALGIINDVFSFLRAKEYGFWWVFFIQSVAIAFLVFITIFRKIISLNFKIFSLILIILTVLVSGLYSFGFLASSKVLIPILPVFLSFIVSYKKALFSLILFFLVYVIFTYLYSTGKIEYSFNLYDYASNLRTWIQDYVVIFLVSWGLLYIGAHFGNALTENYIRIENQNIELKDKEIKYRTLFESSNDAIILIDNKCYFDCNIITFKLFQCNKEYIIGKEPHLFSPEYQPDGQNSHEKANTIFSKVFIGEPQVFDWQHKRPNGELFDVSVSLNLIELGKTKYVQAVLRDITEKKQLEKELEQHRNNLERLVIEQTSNLAATNEELQLTLYHLKNAQSQLIQSEKMASLGVLTAGVSHEINNPLNYIMGGYVGLENYFNENGQLNDEQISILLNSIKTGVDRASNIVRGLNQFSRNNEAFMEECDIHSILNNCLVMINNQFKNRIDIHKYFTNETIKVSGNVGKLHQVFINILTNSSQAINEKGSISIKTQKQNETIIIEISDSGNGISKENLAKITDPFFTTKDPGKGTGLGLAIVYNIIQDHKGTIEFQSEINNGTTVTVTLPVNKKWEVT
jgi:PAS domain S-box-containing protein